MRLHTQPRKLLRVQSTRVVVANFPHVPREQSPMRASRNRGSHLPPRQNMRIMKRHLRPPRRILRQRNQSIGSIQPNSNQINLGQFSSLERNPRCSWVPHPSILKGAGLDSTIPVSFRRPLPLALLLKPSRPPQSYPTNDQQPQTSRSQNSNRSPMQRHLWHSRHTPSQNKSPS